MRNILEYLSDRQRVWAQAILLSPLDVVKELDRVEILRF
jgi:hypothetical protein